MMEIPMHMRAETTINRIQSSVVARLDPNPPRGTQDVPKRVEVNSRYRYENDGDSYSISSWHVAASASEWLSGSVKYIANTRGPWRLQNGFRLKPIRPFAWRTAVLVITTCVGAAVHAAPFHRDSLHVPDSAKFTVTLDEYPGLTNPNPNGWYYKCANVVRAQDGSLVACWQISDNHTSLTSWIMVARSTDGGRTWREHRPISHANVWQHRAVWVVPQMSVLRDGRIVIVCDRGQRTPGQNFPMLSDWQKPDRGMSNWIFWSSDHGQTWTQGEKVDSVGGEPGYVVELSDGTLAYTRTSSKKTDQLKNPPAPWNDIYYRNEIVFSDDRGKSWKRKTWLENIQYHGD